MPKLKVTDKTPRNLQEKFDKMYAALLRHEENHGKYGIAAATEIEAAACSNTDAIFTKYNKADRDYDKRTNHGAKEGVILP